MKSAEGRHVPSHGTPNDEERREHEVGSDSEDQKKHKSGRTARTRGDLQLVKEDSDYGAGR